MKRTKKNKSNCRTFCWFCGCEMIWGADFDYEDYGLEGSGVVATLSCPNCDAYCEFYSGDEKEV